MALSVQQSQRQLIACALEVLADADFALAGSGAIREHGMGVFNCLCIRHFV